nr:glycine N-acyltransferase-like protein 3 isoform X1 [Pogona vitticeps]
MCLQPRNTIPLFSSGPSSTPSPLLVLTCFAAPVRPAMLILTCPSKLQLLEGVLRRCLPETLPIYGAILHINRGNPAQSEVVVDSWPEFKAIITRPKKEVVKDKWDYYANFYAAFYRDADSCRALLENNDVVDWSAALQIQGLQDGLYEIVKEIAEASHVQLEPYFYRPVMHPDPSTLRQSRLTNDLLRFGALNPSHASFLNEVWDFGGNHRSRRYLESLIRLFPSACLVDKEDQVVSWSLTDPVSCLSHGYTLRQYRGQGCSGIVLQRLGGKLHSLGFPLYAGVLAENQPSLQTLKKQGFHILPGTYYMLTVKPNLALKN